LQEEAMREHRHRYPQRKKVRGMAYEAAEADDGDYRDGQNAARAIATLRQRAAEPDQPFFLAVGFYKPHLPFTAPQKYWDLYDDESIDVPPNYRKPNDIPEQAWHSSGELRAYAGIPPQGIVDRETARQLIHGYYACVSFIDAQIGRVIAELDRLKLADNTIIVLWGDHGWNLGEHALWCKHSCFETSLHAPLLMIAPGDQRVRAGGRVAGMTEFIDIYPSLCDLTGLPQPAHLQGVSLLPQLQDPAAPGKAFAISRYRRGDTIRTPHYRLSEYNRKPTAPPAMLYDHRDDPSEDENLAGQADVAEIQHELSATLRRHWGHDAESPDPGRAP
jgi:arylsulfatase A-like enzyme